MRGQLLRYPSPGWAEKAFAEVFPGAHVLVYGRNRDALAAEDAGFEVRDGIEVLGPLRHRVWLFRKPATAANLVAQVLSTATGALYIDGCRIAGIVQASCGAVGGYGGSTSGPYQLGVGQPFHDRGRWPTNLVLIHTPVCQKMGVRQVRSDGHHPSKRNGAGLWSKMGGGLNGNSGPERYMGEAGVETVDAWACDTSCPVWRLDRQSGDRPATLTGRADGPQENPATARPAALWGSGMKGGIGQVYADNGGASRYFPQFANEEELDAWLLLLILGPGRGA